MINRGDSNDINRLREDSKWQGEVNQSLRDIRSDIKELKDTQKLGIAEIKEAVKIGSERLDGESKKNDREHLSIRTEIGHVRTKLFYVIGVGTAAGAAIATALRIFGGFGK